jgi:23S rRNA (guanosine2251-2'-O)-methyltransferase
MARELLYGRRPVLESLRAGRRNFFRVIFGSDPREAQPLAEIAALAREKDIRVDTMRRDWLDQQAHGANHQGVLLEASGYPYVSLDEVLIYAKQRSEPPMVLLLDLIQDVQNVGTLLRTAEAVGVHGVVLQERRAAEVTPAVVSASSGAVEHLQIAQVTNLVSAMKEMKARDVWLAGLDTGEDAVNYDKANLKGAIGLVVGSEGSGLRRLVRENCDFIVSLPMKGRVESLNAAVAGSVILYAAWQARSFT